MNSFKRIYSAVNAFCTHPTLVVVLRTLAPPMGIVYADNPP